MGAVAAHLIASGVGVSQWWADAAEGFYSIERRGGVELTDGLRDSHGCLVYELQWSSTVYSREERSGWEMYVIPASRFKDGKATSFIPNRIPLAASIFLPSPQELLSDLRFFVSASTQPLRNGRILPESAHFRLSDEEMAPKLEPYVSQGERIRGTARCCSKGTCRWTEIAGVTR